jgi:hypothetical protein
MSSSKAFSFEMRPSLNVLGEICALSKDASFDMDGSSAEIADSVYQFFRVASIFRGGEAFAVITLGQRSGVARRPGAR